MEMRRAVTVPRSIPPYVKIEPSALCQLHCPGCEHRDPGFNRSVNDFTGLELKTLKKIIDPIGDKLLAVSLSGYGEPMINKDLTSLIEYIHSKNIGVNFPTNFSLKLSEEKLEQLVKSGLDSIIISLDGATEETYRVYRAGGNFDLVLNNVKALSEMKKRLKSTKPKIIWKFIVFKHNKHEVEKVETLYKALGFDYTDIVVDVFDQYSLDYKQGVDNNWLKTKKPCYWLWNTLLVRWDGTVKPCCRLFIDNQPYLGNVLEEDIINIWQGERYKKLRQGFTKKDYGRTMHHLCRVCIGLDE